MGAESGGTKIGGEVVAWGGTMALEWARGRRRSEGEKMRRARRAMGGEEEGRIWSSSFWCVVVCGGVCWKVEDIICCGWF